MEEMVGRGSGMVSVEIPFTPASKRVLGDGVSWPALSGDMRYHADARYGGNLLAMFFLLKFAFFGNMFCLALIG